MLLNSEALFEEDGGIDHHVHIVLGLRQRVVVVVHIHLHCLTQSLRIIVIHILFSEQRRKLEEDKSKTWQNHLESMVVLISLAGWHSQIILACQREDNLNESISMGSPGNHSSCF